MHRVTDSEGTKAPRDRRLRIPSKPIHDFQERLPAKGRFREQERTPAAEKAPTTNLRDRASKGGPAESQTLSGLAEPWIIPAESLNLNRPGPLIPRNPVFHLPDLWPC